MGNEGLGLWPLSWDAATLLDKRLRARRAAMWASVPFVLVAVGAIAVAPESSNDVAIRCWTIYVAALGIGCVVRQWTVVRRDRALAVGLRRRAAPLVQRSVTRDAGWAPLTGAALVTFAAITLLVWMAAVGAPTSVVLPYGMAFALALICAAAGIRLLGSGPVVAVDDSSLAVDERLRCMDLWDSFFPIGVLAASVMMPVGLGTPPGTFGLWIMIGPASLLASTLLRQLSPGISWGRRRLWIGRRGGYTTP